MLTRFVSTQLWLTCPIIFFTKVHNACCNKHRITVSYLSTCITIVRISDNCVGTVTYVDLFVRNIYAYDTLLVIIKKKCFFNSVIILNIGFYCWPECWPKCLYICTQHVIGYKHNMDVILKLNNTDEEMNDLFTANQPYVPM